jgi:hypothetical protein
MKANETIKKLRKKISYNKELFDMLLADYQKLQAEYEKLNAK